MTTKLSESEGARLRSALTELCRQAGIDPAGAQLIRYTMNAVYLLPAGDVVVRMATGPQAAERTARVAAVAEFFATLDLPTVRLAPGIHQPIHLENWSATVWEYLPQPSNRRFTPVELAEPLRAIHALHNAPFALPAWDPIGKARHRIGLVENLGAESREMLREWAKSLVRKPLEVIIDYLRETAEILDQKLEAVTWTLPRAVIYGDAHAGNLLLNKRGDVVICDFDSVAIGPPEWDLVPAAHGVVRFGDDPANHEALAEAYGFDVTTSPAWEAVRQVRELQLVTSVIASIPGRPGVAEELAHRLRTSLANDQTSRWHRYR